MKNKVRGLALTVGTSAKHGVFENLSPVRLFPFARMVSRTVAESAMGIVGDGAELEVDCPAGNRGCATDWCGTREVEA